MGESLLETAEFTFLIKTGLQESGEVMVKHAAFFFSKNKRPSFPGRPSRIGCWVPFSEFQGNPGQKGLLLPSRLGQVNPRLALHCG